MEPVGIEPTSKRPQNQTFITRLLVLLSEAHHWNKSSGGCKMLELVQRTRKLVETNYCVVMNRSIAGDLTIHLYFVVLIKADDIRMITTVTKK